MYLYIGIYLLYDRQQSVHNEQLKLNDDILLIILLIFY